MKVKTRPSEWQQGCSVQHGTPPVGPKREIKDVIIITFPFPIWLSRWNRGLACVTAGQGLCVHHFPQYQYKQIYSVMVSEGPGLVCLALLNTSTSTSRFILLNQMHQYTYLVVHNIYYHIVYPYEQSLQLFFFVCYLFLFRISLLLRFCGCDWVGNGVQLYFKNLSCTLLLHLTLLQGIFMISCTFFFTLKLYGKGHIYDL